MELNINEIIDDFFVLREGYIMRDGFVFTLGQQYPTVFNRLVIRTQPRAKGDEGRLGYSYRTLEEHIQIVREYQIKKLLIICDNLEFIVGCPSVEDIKVYPSYDAPAEFDYSPLYQMPNLKRLSCKTIYGTDQQYRTTIDYSKIRGLESVVVGEHGHIGFEKVPTLKEIWISGNKTIRELSQISCSPVLEDVTFLQCGVQSLNGIEKYSQLKSLTFFHNRSLQHLSALTKAPESLEELTIEACPKINDFTALNSLQNLRFLSLIGNNVLPDLQFLKNMKKLMLFNFTVNVKNGDLRNCMNVPYVTCRNRKHYNLTDKELPKNLTPVQEYHKRGE